MTLSRGIRVGLLVVLVVLAGGLAAPSYADPGASPVVVHFDGYHAVNSRASARTYLPGTSPAFQRFAARAGAAERRWAVTHHESRQCIRRSGVMVTDYLDGYAKGAAGGCGGYAAVWSNRARGGTTVAGWHQIIGTQDSWYCGDLHRYRVPSALVGETCYAARRQTEKAYHQDWLPTAP